MVTKLLFTDTDSLTYDVETEDVIKDFLVDKEKFDFKNYNLNSEFYDSKKEYIIGELKDEIGRISVA